MDSALAKESAGRVPVDLMTEERSRESSIDCALAASGPKPFVWTKSADDILASIARFATRTLAITDETN